MFETKQLRELTRIHLKDFIDISRTVIISSICFIDEYNFGLCTVQGHILALHYPSGQIHFDNKLKVKMIFYFRKKFKQNVK